jgi:hypothetical protein
VDAVNVAAIGTHLAGSVGQLVGNKGRLMAHRGVGTMALVKTGLTVTALAITAYSRILGARVSAHQAVPVFHGTTPSAKTHQRSPPHKSSWRSCSGPCRPSPARWSS